MASAFRKSTPIVAPLPVATMMDMGVARPSAHGQAMMRTATALTRACASRGSGPIAAQIAKVAAATAMTAGTKTPAATSARRWMGARLRCASPTSATMRASTVSAPTRSARMTNAPAPLTVAPTSRSPGSFETGMGSPVSIDSSTAPWPSSTRPSTGIFSPGRTRRRSPTTTPARSTSSSMAWPPSPRSRRARLGARSSSARSADPVRARARSSSTWPSSTSVTMPAAASKYAPTWPASSRNDGGKTPGSAVATTRSR